MCLQKLSVSTQNTHTLHLMLPSTYQYKNIVCHILLSLHICTIHILYVCCYFSHICKYCTSNISTHTEEVTLYGLCQFNPLPDDKILCLPYLKAFADVKLNVTQNVKVVFHTIAAFSSFPTMFPNGFFPPVCQMS